MGSLQQGYQTLVLPAIFSIWGQFAYVLCRWRPRKVFCGLNFVSPLTARYQLWSLFLGNFYITPTTSVMDSTHTPLHRSFHILPAHICFILDGFGKVLEASGWLFSWFYWMSFFGFSVCFFFLFFFSFYYLKIREH